MATQYLYVPHELVGKDIVHKFITDGTEDEEEELWDGRIIIIRMIPLLRNIQ